MIDQQFVFWAVEDRACADASYAYSLYGSTPDDVRCNVSDSYIGRRGSCTDASLLPLFDTITGHLDEPDLGLGSGHSVRKVVR